MAKIEEIKKFYDDATFQKLHGIIHTNYRVEYAWQSLTVLFKLLKPRRILEIGCGVGEISFRLASEFPDTNVTGFDISERSIEIGNALFSLPNLKYVQADSITESKVLVNGKYDLIFLMDVYEHIPVEFRTTLHKFIKDNISENAFVFLSCPTPQHLDYLRVNKPEEIQPIDENISLIELLDFANSTRLKLTSYREISVWHACDYFHVVFSNFLNMQLYSDYIKLGSRTSVNLKEEMKYRLVEKFKISKNNLIEAKKALIRDKLGANILEKIESLYLQ